VAYKPSVRWKRLIENLAEIARLPSRITTPIAEKLNVELQKEFNTGADPYGTPWVKLAPSTIKKKKGSTLIMIDTRTMRVGTKAVTLPGAGIALVSVEYAKYHQGKAHDGSRPARPVLPNKSELPERWQQIVALEWSRAFKRTMER
jgi:hypothetical protein